MKRFFPVIVVLFFPLLSTEAGASLSNANDREQMVQNLDVISNSFSVQYAPTEWKREYAEWDLDIEINKAKELVYTTDPLSVKDFQRIVLGFFKSAKDYHVGVSFFSTESASLPFKVKSANGKYFFTYVDHTKLSPAVFPFNPGDELVAFDGKPVKDVVADLKNSYVGNISELTDKSMAEILLTSRVGALGHEVPNGPVSITVKPMGKNSLSKYQLIWEYYPEKVISKGVGDFTKKPEATPVLNPIVDALMAKEMTVPFYKALKKQELPKTEEDLSSLGSRKSFIPFLGKLWWVSDENSPFHAYIYETEDRSFIGYVRIPHYQGGEYEVQEFAAIMQLFEDRTDALIIDQVNNPGGSLFYLYSLASTLTDQPLYTPKHRISISQADVMEAVKIIPLLEEVKSDSDAIALLGDNLGGTPITFQMAQFMLNYFRFIVSEWNAGKTLTAPYYLYGIDQINPHPSAQYTKPILLLTNELDFSGGDFFPAILQDNKRVTILGERTAGAGGFVAGCYHPNHFGIAGYSYTASIAERIDNNPIENLGIQPDIQYSITEDDLCYYYYDYIQVIHQAVHSLTN